MPDAKTTPALTPLLLAETILRAYEELNEQKADDCTDLRRMIVRTWRMHLRLLKDRDNNP